MNIPKQYVGELSSNNKKKQIKELKKSRKLYQKGIFYERKKMPSFKSKKSRHIVEFEKKYDTKITDLKKVSKVTNVPISVLKKIINKGMGAYYSSGSRPNQNAHSWGYARLASALLKHNSYKIDKHLFYDKNNKLIEIKKPSKTSKSSKSSNKKKIISCCKITVNNESKYTQCKRKDGKQFKLPRRFNRKKCKEQRGFTMRSSCAPYSYC